MKPYHPYAKYIGRDYMGQRPCQQPLAYFHLLTTAPRQSNPVALWLRKIVGRFL